MTSQFVVDLLAVAQPAVKLIQKDFWGATRSDSENKRDFQDIVTATDKQSQELLVAGITQFAKQRGMENFGFIGEENGLAEAEVEHIFIMDPIDGTTNFASRIPYCGISIAYAYQHQVVAGLIIQPLTGEYWWAEQGQGAWYVNPTQQISRALHINFLPLADSIIATTYNSRSIAVKQFPWYQQLYDHVRAERNFGAAVIDLAFCAQNIIQGTLNAGCCIWDLAATKLLIEEAGGAMTTLEGRPLEFNWADPKQLYQLIAGHPTTIAEIIKFRPAISI